MIFETNSPLDRADEVGIALLVQQEDVGSMIKGLI